VSITVKIALFAPNPSASVRITAITKPGRRGSVRTASTTGALSNAHPRNLRDPEHLFHVARDRFQRIVTKEHAQQPARDRRAGRHR
jgi:hypothetical protein